MKRLLLGLTTLVLATSGLILVHNTFLLNDFRATTSNIKVDVLVEPGDTGFEIARKLKDLGVIKTEKVFNKIAINNKQSMSISPGLHKLDQAISAQSAFEQLLDSKRNKGLFGFAEGLRKTEIFGLLKKSRLVTGSYSGKTVIEPIYGTSNIEGFLFPAQYPLFPGTTFDEAVTQMVKRFYLAAAESGITKGYKTYSPYDLLIMASMI